MSCEFKEPLNYNKSLNPSLFYHSPPVLTPVSIKCFPGEQILKRKENKQKVLRLGSACLLYETSNEGGCRALGRKILSRF